MDLRQFDRVPVRLWELGDHRRQAGNERCLAAVLLALGAVPLGAVPPVDASQLCSLAGVSIAECVDTRALSKGVGDDVAGDLADPRVDTLRVAQRRKLRLDPHEDVLDQVVELELAGRALGHERAARQLPHRVYALRFKPCWRRE